MGDASFLAGPERAVIEEMLEIWLKETRYHSSVQVMIEHYTFRELMEKGEPILRLLLEHLVDGDVQIHWFPLMKRIAGVDPVPAGRRGFVREMAEDWISWGRKEGYLER